MERLGLISKLYFVPDFNFAIKLDLLFH